MREFIDWESALEEIGPNITEDGQVIGVGEKDGN